MRTWETQRGNITEFHVSGDDAFVEQVLAARPPGAITSVYVDDAPPTRSPSRDGHRRQRDVMPGERTDGDIDAPRDANAGAPGGEWRSDIQHERWDSVPEYTNGGGGGVPATPPYNPEPSRYVDMRSLRVTGRDAEGKQFSAAIWGAYPQETDWTRDPTPTTQETGDRAGGFTSHVQRLSGYQAHLNRHYRRNR